MTKHLKRPISLLLSFLMIVSLFTIVPVSASATGGDNPTATVSKWVEGMQDEPDYYGFDDDYNNKLYENFIFCRVNPDMNPETDGWSAVYNQTYDLDATGQGNDNVYYLDSYKGNNDNHMDGHWYYFSPENPNATYVWAGDRGNGTNFGGAEIWAYTWKDVPLTEHAPVSPTYVNGEYKDGTNRTYYTWEDLYFVYDSDSGKYVEISEEDLFNVHYFEFGYNSSTNTCYLDKCNSNDEDIIVPSTIPAKYYPSDAPSGKNFNEIRAAFCYLTNLKNVTIGNNVKKLSGGPNDGMLTGSFQGCTNLKTVTVGSSLERVETMCFRDCLSLTDFTTTSLYSSNYDPFRGLYLYNNQHGYDITLKIHCYHESGLASEFANNSNIELVYLDDSVTHVYMYTWDWSGFDEDAPDSSVSIDFGPCSICGKNGGTHNAEITQVVDTPATCAAEGSGHYLASCTYEGITYTDTDQYNGGHTYTIPVTNHNWDMDDDDVDWSWTPDDGSGYTSNISAKMTAHCEDCDAEQEVNAVVEYDHADMPSCTSRGYEHYIATAEFNGKTFSDTNAYELPIMNHNAVYVPAKEPTLTEDGNIAYYRCTQCGNYFTDSSGNNEITDKSSVIIPKTAVAKIGDDHYYADVMSAIAAAKDDNAVIDLLKDSSVDYSDAQNCEDYPSFKIKKNGYTLDVDNPHQCYSLSSADDNGVTTYTLTAHHTYDSSPYTYILEGTEGNYQMVAYRYCTVCGASEIRGTGTAVKHAAVAPTCSATGNIEYCTMTVPGLSATYCLVPTTNPTHQNQYTMVTDDMVILPIDSDNHNLTHRAAAAPTYENGEYKDGNIEYYECSDCHKKFSDENGENEIDDIVVPYFEFKYHSGIDKIKLEKCNSDDEEIIIPETIPAKYYPDGAPANMTFDIIAGKAFYGKTNLKKVIMGDNINHIGADIFPDISVIEPFGAFEECTALEEVVIGYTSDSDLEYIAPAAFWNCGALTDITVTSVNGTYNPDNPWDKDANSLYGLFSAYNNPNFDSQAFYTLHCYHDSVVARFSNDKDIQIPLTFLDDSVTHTYSVVDWDWSTFDIDGKVKLNLHCSVCNGNICEEAEVTQVVDTPATCTAEGSGHYLASYTYEGTTYTDTDNGGHTCTIPVTAHNWDMDDNDVDWSWTPDDGSGNTSNISAKMTAHCEDCDAEQEVNAVVEYYHADMPSCTSCGYKHYIATAEFNGKTFSNTNAYVLPVTQHNMTHVSAVSPTYENGEYKDGNIEYYECSDCHKKFSDENGENEIDDIVVPYFEFKYHSDINKIKLEKCNSDDEEIIIPETIPAKYYPDDAPANMTFDIIAGAAFYGKTNLTKVTMGDNINHIGMDAAPEIGDDDYYGAFEECTALEEVIIGYTSDSDLEHIATSAFYNCGALTDFTITSVKGVYNSSNPLSKDENSFYGLYNVHKDEEFEYLADFIIHCYHDSVIARFSNDENIKIPLTFLDDSVTHTYDDINWDWSTFDTDGKVKLNLHCSVCNGNICEEAEVTQVVDTPATCTTDGSGYYKASVTTDDNQTFEDTDNNSHTYSIPAAHTLIYNSAVAPKYENGEYINGHTAYYECSACHKKYADALGAVEITDSSSIVVPYFTFDIEEGIRITGYNGEDTNVIIPAKVPDSYYEYAPELENDTDWQSKNNTYGVEVIAPNAFKGNDNIESVTSDKFLQLIGSRAFENCTSLTEVTLKSVGTVYADSFDGCSSLETFTVVEYAHRFHTPNFADTPDSLTFVGDHITGTTTKQKSVLAAAAETFNKEFRRTDDHEYGEPVWVWNQFEASATFSCFGEDDTQTVNAVVTSEVTTQPTETEKGERTYTAVVTGPDGITYTDYKYEDIPKLTYTKLSVASADAEYYKDSAGKYYSKNGDDYTEITDEDTISFLSLVDETVTVDTSLDSIAAANPAVAAQGYIGARFLGFQTAALNGEETKADSLRFVTEVSSDILKKLNSDDEADYGYVFAALKTTSTSTYDKLTIDNSKAHKYSCKNTTNTVSGDYGDTDFDSTDYKYITAGVNDVPKDAKLAARFYVTYRGTTYYVNYAARESVTGIVFNTNGYIG